MRDFIGKLIICIALVAFPITALQACQTIPSPTAVGCTEAEAPVCRGIIAASILDGATTAVDRELTRGTITAQEARRIHTAITQGRDALVAYRTALPLLDGTAAERLEALDAILLRVVQAQAGFGG